MTLNRRNFLHLSSLTAGTGVLASLNSCTTEKEQPKVMQDEVKSMTQNVVPISLSERQARIEKAQRLMTESKLEALVLDAGTSMEYFTGITWHPSERPMIAIIPAKGEVQYVCPGFEE